MQDMVLICLDGVGVKQVSWAVRYLDKPRWRAVRGRRDGAIIIATGDGGNLSPD